MRRVKRKRGCRKGGEVGKGIGVHCVGLALFYILSYMLTTQHEYSQHGIIT